MAQDELFTLANGQMIADAHISAILYGLKKIRPESGTQEDTTPYSWDEAGLADLFAQFYSDCTRYCAEHKSWYTYDGVRWVKDTEGLLAADKIKEFVRIMFLYCAEIPDEQLRNNYIKFITKTGDLRFRERLLKDCRTVLNISATDFDNHPELINCNNGTFDLRSLKFREHSYKDYITMVTNFAFLPGWDKVKCDRWDKFVDEVTEGNKPKAKYLQKALGYSLLGSAPEECMFMLYGKTTRNGKSTMLNTLEHMLGDYSCVAPVELICRTRKSGAEAASPVLSSLKGKRFVTMAESENTSKLDESLIKQLTGGEEIMARPLYGHPINYLPQFTLWLSCNDLPEVKDKSLFASDRLRVVEFTRHFTKDEQDKSLKTYFETDEAMKGIFAWLLKGYILYKRDGLLMPDDMQQVVNQYAKDNDAIINFLEDCYEMNPDGRTTAKNLYEDYKIWCRKNNFYQLSLRKFTAEMIQHTDWYDEITRPNNRITFNGLSAQGDDII